VTTDRHLSSLSLVTCAACRCLFVLGGGSRTFVVGAESPEESRIIDDFNAKIRAGGYRLCGKGLCAGNTNGEKGSRESCKRCMNVFEQVQT